MTGLIFPKDIHHLSPAASMNLLTVHHFDEPRGAAISLLMHNESRHNM
jgi:hypothetical protein